jgi:transcriptional regulator GlxA family with amidase domain
MPPKARRRLLAEPGDVTTVAFAVGDESASQFNREYTWQNSVCPQAETQPA